jgi:hypothetical protein
MTEDPAWAGDVPASSEYHRSRLDENEDQMYALRWQIRTFRVPLAIENFFTKRVIIIDFPRHLLCNTSTHYWIFRVTNSAEQSAWEGSTVGQSIYPTLYGTRRFITVFTTSRNWSVYSAKQIQSTPSNPISPRPISISSSYVCLARSSDRSLPFSISNQNSICIHLPRACYMPWYLIFPCNNSQHTCQSRYGLVSSPPKLKAAPCQLSTTDYAI